MIKHIYLFRHGQTDWNKEKRLQGHKDISLNETGQKQSSEITPLLKENKIEIIFSSDLQRAKETASLATQDLDRPIPIILNKGPREVDLGDAEGLSYSEVLEKYGEEYWDKWISFDPKFNDHGFPNGETKNQATDRAFTALESFITDSDPKRIAVITHGFLIQLIILKIDPNFNLEVPIKNGPSYQLEFHVEEKIWKIKNLISASH